MDRSPQWAKNAANAAKRRAMNRTIRNQNRVDEYDETNIPTVFKVSPGTVKNREGRKYRFFKGRNWWKDPEQISGPPMPNTWLPESGYGASPRPYYTMEPPEQEFGVYNAATGETAYGGRRRKTRRSSRKTRRSRR
jgi:hypothetical protein